MSYNLGLIACPNLQGLLDENFNLCSPLEALPVTEIMFSEANMSGIAQRVSPGGGKNRTVQLIYTPRILESAVDTTVTFDCTASNKGSQISESYEAPTTGVFISEKFDIRDLTAMCLANPLWYASRIQAMMDVLLRRMETLYTTQLAAMVGKFASDDTDLNVAKTLKTVSTQYSDGKVSPDFIQEISYSAMLAEFCTNPIVIGNGEMTKASRLVAAGCCASYGVDLGTFLVQNPYAYFHSNRIATALGSALEFLMYELGKVQPLWFNLFEGDMNSSNVPGVYEQGVITDPRYGIPFDMTWKNDCGVIYVEIGLKTKLVGLPSDMFDFGDRLYQTNGVYNFVIDNS